MTKSSSSGMGYKSVIDDHRKVKQESLHVSKLYIVQYFSSSHISQTRVRDQKGTPEPRHPACSGCL